MPPRSGPTNRTVLHNLLQETGDQGNLTWEDEQSGPQHQPEWKSKALVGDVEYGEATGANKNQARENAAGEAVKAILADRAERAAGGNVG
ncbi:hypothetical protein JAAARDRAFT_189680 [Jaapia argillacea MUCL 33604]|uniref:DRBM domain-containing protein n=1 Tax=Jaapia argillacea MUCL 33604 TaxID=933084 RepID=A0A067QFQ0_9AGAM|nr:hypothetical protein JAAARDRAFT_189680 [Jaapia argillacea MUCL 33604]